LLAVQAHLWKLGYEWGVPRIAAGDMDRLEAALSAYRSALADGDSLAVVIASHDFHTAVISAAANRELLRATLDRRALVARFILARGEETLTLSGLRLHEAILADIRRRNVTAALQKLEAMAARLMALTSET